MTTVVLLIVALLSLAVTLTNNMTAAIILVVAVGGVWILLETFATTVFLHRNLTHGSWRPSKPNGRLIVFWLWWARSGGVKFWEWTRNHAWHHAFTDTDKDSYTPWVTNRYTGQPPLRPPRFWNFWMNGVSYTRFSKWLEANPEAWDELVASDRTVRRVQARLDGLAWAYDKYGRVDRALWICLTAFTMVALPLALQVGGWWGLLVIVALPWAMLGVKFGLYLTGGQVINYYGHRSKVAPHQSNIPWWWMLLTLFMLGEAWHEFHHYAPWSARFHPRLDPGWWVISLMCRCGWVDRASVVIAKPTSEKNVYEPMTLVGV